MILAFRKNRPSLLFLAFVLVLCNTLSAQIIVKQAESPESVVKVFTANDGLKIRNERFSGNPQAIGTFENNVTESVFSSGVILSTGKASDMAHANDAPKTSTYNAKGGDKNLYSIAGGKTFDFAELEFDFMTDKDSLSFSFIFASEEYNEYVGSTFNDAFDISISGPGMPAGKHFGLIPGTNTPITVNSVNVTNNQQFYQDNNPFTLVGKINEEAKASLEPAMLNNFTYDGLTKRLSVGMRVQPRTAYHFKLSIADAGDGNIDSAVLLEGESFQSLEQYKHVLRRQMIAEQKRQDSLARVQFVADSLARIEFVRDSISQAQMLEEEQPDFEEKQAEIENEQAENSEDTFEEVEPNLIENNSAPDNSNENNVSETAFEIKRIIIFEDGGYLLSAEDEAWLKEMGKKMAQDQQIRAGIFLSGGDSEETVKMRYDFIRLELVKGGSMTTQIFKNGFSFIKAGEEKAAHRAEIWIKKAE